MRNAENRVNIRVSGDKMDEYGLKAARRAPQFSKRKTVNYKHSLKWVLVFCFQSKKPGCLIRDSPVGFILRFQRFLVHAALLDLDGTTFGYERFWRDMSTNFKTILDSSFKSLCNCL